MGRQGFSAYDHCAPVHMHSSEDDNLHDYVRQFFNLESIGVRFPDKIPESLEDTRAYELLKRTVRKLPEGQYEAGLLWRTDGIKLPDSKQMALQRLHSFERKLENVQTREQWFISNSKNM